MCDFARAIGRDEPIVSVYLRQLNARGLLGVRRGLIKVYYDTAQDRTLPDSAMLQACLRTLLKRPAKTDWAEDLITVMKAFSHPNRLAMIVRLSKGPATLAELAQVQGMAVKSMYHHLRFLHDAGLIEEKSAWRGALSVRLVPPQHPLARTLLRITLRNEGRFNRYWNPLPAKETDETERRVLHRIDAAEGNDGPGCWKRAAIRKGARRKLARNVQKALADP